jgi:type I restriction enzyme, S subunit
VSKYAFHQCILDDLAEFRNGKAAPTNNPTGRFSIYGANGEIGFVDQALYDRPVVVIGRVGAYCGNVYRTHGAAWVTDNAIAAIPRTGVDFDFLYYRLLSLDLRRSAIGSACRRKAGHGLLSIPLCQRPRMIG